MGSMSSRNYELYFLKILGNLDSGIKIYQKDTKRKVGNMGSISLKNMKWTFVSEYRIYIFKIMRRKFGIEYGINIFQKT